MDAQQLDTVVRVAGVTLLLLLAVTLIRDSHGRRIGAFFAPLAVCLCGFLVGNTADASLRLDGAVGAVAHLLSGYAAVFLWWFCLAVFDRTFKPRGRVLAVGLAWLFIASADRGVLGPQLADKGLSRLLVAVGFGMVVHLGWRLIRDREGDLVEGRRNARVLVVALLAGQLLVDLSVDAIFGSDWRPRAFTIAQNTAILAFTLWLLGLLLRPRSDALSLLSGVAAGSVATHRAIGAAQNDAEDGLAARLRTLVEIERIHLDPEITFDVFVQRMGAPARAVRRLINHRLGHDHFRSFLNAHRMAEARRLLADPNRAGDKLISIALDSGFASLASFNRVFRVSQGCTPSTYRETLRRGVTQNAPAPSFDERSAAF
jgi:AraC-like DNA-binding protein